MLVLAALLLQTAAGQAVPPPGTGPVLKLAGVAAFLERGDRGRPALAALLPADAKVIGYEQGPDYALLAAAQGAKVRRFLAAFDGILTAFDLTLDSGAPPRREEQTGTLRQADVLSKVQAGDGLLLTVYALEGKLPEARNIPGADFAGVRIGRRILLFYTEPTMLKSAASFFVPGTDTVEMIVAGLAPGTWEIWRNGWLEESMAVITPGSAALRFEGEAGSYFLRRR